MDELRIGQLTKEMVAEELRLLGDPCAKAAAVVLRTLAAALTGPSAASTPPERVIEDAVKGAMTALLLAEQNLAKGSVLVLETVVEVASQRQIDPTEAMRAALKGIADLRRFVDPMRIDEIRREVESRYMGTSEVLGEFLREPVPPGAASPRSA